MGKVKFTIEDSEIAELLGRQNFSTKESAVFELVKNCYDAGSKVCDIYIETNYIKIVDSGDGMSTDDINLHWMHVGKSNKGYKRKNSSRVLTGSKGVGRFALARLGDRAKVISKQVKKNAVIWETDWVTSVLEGTIVDFDKGTSIEISDLRDRWRAKDIGVLIDFLSRSYKGEDMTINVHFEGKLHNVQPVFKNLKKGVDFVSKITLDYDSDNMQLTVLTESDEFKQEVSQLIKPISLTNYKKVFNMHNEIKSNIEELNTYLSKLGDFSAELYFALDRIPMDSEEKFMYKHKNLNSIDTGIILNRNNFSISSLEGKKDWLDLASRAGKSPAAATHPTGSWRVRKNQISGYVTIDKEKNANLRDMANRQGLEEDEFYQIFQEIIIFGISRFEKYRQSIIRKIDENQREKKKGKESNQKENKKLAVFLKKPSTVTKMSKEEITSLVDEIKDIQRVAKEEKKEHKENEQQHKYDVRILNVLATQGLRASSIAHELHNKRNVLETGYKDIVYALEEFGFWEELNSDERTRVSYKNVPKILENLEQVNNKLIAFLDVILNKIEREKFSSRIDSINKTIGGIVDTWSEEYNWVKIDIKIKNELLDEYKISNDVLEVIFDNLILNSIQHNQMKDKLLVNIEVESANEYLYFKYSDNGSGLNPKYKTDPKRILEVHETSRVDGHGLGLWIVNNTLHMYGGKVTEIHGENGFNIYFNIKG